MNDSKLDRAHEVALFRYGLIADLVRLEPGSKGLYALIEQKAAGEYTIPGSTRTRVAAETLRDWLKRYRRGGFEALLPKARADRGQSRSLPAQVVDALLAIKEGNPALSVQLVIREARKHPEVREDLPLPASTVHRLLARHGLMDKPGSEHPHADRRRFAFQQAGASGAALALAARLVPGAVSAPIAAVLASRMRGLLDLIAITWIRIGAILAGAIVLATDGPMWLLYAAVVIEGIGSGPMHALHIRALPLIARRPDEPWA